MFFCTVILFVVPNCELNSVVVLLLHVIMFVEGEDDALLKDQVVIENEVLCIKRNKANLKCDIILCHLE